MPMKVSVEVEFPVPVTALGLHVSRVPHILVIICMIASDTEKMFEHADIGGGGVA
jgi:hypothetical protein